MTPGVRAAQKLACVPPVAGLLSSVADEHAALLCIWEQELLLVGRRALQLFPAAVTSSGCPCRTSPAGRLRLDRATRCIPSWGGLADAQIELGGGSESTGGIGEGEGER